MVRTTPRGERLSIRPYVYQGVQGFLIRGTGGDGYPTSIHTRTRYSAEVIRNKVYADEDVTLADFSLTDAGDFTIPRTDHVQLGAGL